MRKLLLLAAVTLAAQSTQAQTWGTTPTWAKTAATVDVADQLGGTEVAVAADGSVISTGTYNVDFAFGQTTLANPDKMTSAYVAKYNADGTEAWAVGMYGSSIVRAVDTDAEGNVFVAGNIADVVEFSSADGKTQEVKGMDAETAMVTGFLAKYDKNGNLLAVKTIIPEADADVLNSFMYFPMSGDVNFYPRKIEVDGDKMYVAAQYQGDVKMDNLAWEGAYLNVFDFMYMDVASVGILSVNASDLGNATNVANLQAKETISYVQQNPESVCFTVDNGTVYAGFVVKGAQNLTTPKGVTELTTQLPNDESGNVEHAFVMAKITDAETTAKTYNVAMHDRNYGTDIIGEMILDGGNLYVGGTFYGELGFDTAKKSTGSSDVFVASVNPETFATNWATIDGYDEGDVTSKEERIKNMVLYKGTLFVNAADQSKSGELAKALCYNITTDGTLTAVDGADYAALAANDAAVATLVVDGVNTTVSKFGTGTDAIEAIKDMLTNKDTKIYNILGLPVPNTQKLTKGLYIINGKKVIVK